MYSIYRKCIDCSHAKLLITHENSCHFSFQIPPHGRVLDLVMQTLSLYDYRFGVVWWISAERRHCEWMGGTLTIRCLTLNWPEKGEGCCVLGRILALCLLLEMFFLHLDYWYSSISMVDWSLLLIAPQNLGGGQDPATYFRISLQIHVRARWKNLTFPNNKFGKGQYAF